MSHQMAPWVPMFIQSCKNNTEPFVSFQFATVDKLTNKPRCRTVVFRDFLFHDKKTNVLTFNTDMRSSKISESFLAPKSSDSRGNEKCETPFFEACVYFPETWEQYRFSGQSFIISRQFKEIPDDIVVKYDIFSSQLSEKSDDSTDEDTDTSINDDHDKNNDINDDNKLIEIIDNDERHTAENDYYPKPEEWEAELLRQWSSLSRHTKSLYRKPAPGQKLTSETSKQLDKLHRGVDGAKEDVGLENFGIVCLCVESVDFLNLKEGRGGERWIFQKTDGKDEDLWEEQEVCP